MTAQTSNDDFAGDQSGPDQRGGLFGNVNAVSQKVIIDSQRKVALRRGRVQERPSCGSHPTLDCASSEHEPRYAAGS